MLKYAAAFAVSLCSTAFAEETTIQQSMPFSTCVESLRTAPEGATQPPVVTIDTETVKQAQVPVSDGKVTITCDALSQQATMTHTR